MDTSRINTHKYFTECRVCGTPVDGRYSRGDKYYCQTHFEKTSASEKALNKLIDRKEKIYKKMVGADD